MSIKRDNLTERRLEEESYIARENNNTASGLLLGILLAAILGLAGAAFYFMNQRQESPTKILPIPVPNSSQPQSEPQSTQKDTTIIDRTINRTKEVIPVPQQQAPAPQQQAPDININVPSQPQQAPDVQQQAPDTPNINVAPEQPQNQGTDQSSTSSDQQ